MLALALLSALSLSASAAPPPAARLPYPAPKVVQATEKTKCDTGKVIATEPENRLFRGATPAGLVTYKVAPDVQVIGKDGKPAGDLSALAPGQKYRAYYLVDGGARVVEIDLE
jgi:hypothetical protein